jgi:hypothetical protein
MRLVVHPQRRIRLMMTYISLETALTYILHYRNSGLVSRSNEKAIDVSRLESSSMTVPTA